MRTDLETPLTAFEVRALNRVGLTPQNLPRSLDDFIRMFLWEKAEVDVRPVSSSSLIGGSSAAFASGFTSALVKEGGASLGTSLTTGNIKKQTAVQEWIHWKKYALDSPDFERYREESAEKPVKNYETMVRYIRSDKGKECLSYERWRPITRVFIVVVSAFGSLLGWIAALIANSILINKKGVSLPEWVIQKILGKRPFTSIKPLIQVNDGLLELEY